MKKMNNGLSAAVGSAVSRRMMARRAMLVAGILSSLLYIAIVASAAWRWEGYDSTSQTVSELIAIDAPTRPLVVIFFIVYALLVYLFAAGVWQSDADRSGLRISAVGLASKEILGLVVTLYFPIHLRGIETTSTDIIHGILTMAGVVLMLLAIGAAATVLGRRFRLYSIATILLLIAGGILTGMDASRMGANLPTPGMGVWERINIFGYMLWVVVLAIILLRDRSSRLNPAAGLEAIGSGGARRSGAMAMSQAGGTQNDHCRARFR